MSAPSTTVLPNPWLQVLSALEKKINRHSYDTWLKPTRFSHIEGKLLVVKVPTPEFRHIGEKYGDLIQEAIENLNLEFEDVQFVAAEEPPAPRTRPSGGFAPVPSHAPTPPARPTAV